MTPFDATLASGEEMLQAARAADWERVRTLQPVRDRQLKAVFDDLPADHTLAPLLEPVRRLVQQNRELVKLATHERDAHGERLGVLRAGERARKAYAASRG